MDMTVINLWEYWGADWGDCPMCDQEKRLNRSVGWYEEAVHEDIGATLPHGGEVGGMPVCQDCHDKHYGITA